MSIETIRAVNLTKLAVKTFSQKRVSMGAAPPKSAGKKPAATISAGQQRDPSTPSRQQKQHNIENSPIAIKDISIPKPLLEAKKQSVG